MKDMEDMKHGRKEPSANIPGRAFPKNPFMFFMSFMAKALDLEGLHESAAGESR